MAFTMTVAELIAADRSGLLGKHASWERVPLAMIADVLNGAPFDSSLFSTTAGMPLVRIRDVLSGSTSTFYAGEYESEYVVQAGDLLVGMDGDFNSGYWRSAPALLNQRVCKLRVKADFYDKRLLAFALPGYLSAINANTSSITVKHLSSRTIGEIDLPLPPRAEQLRIAAKLDELLSGLEAGEAELKAAQKKLTQYRQSLLKAAVEGALTASWREQQRAQHPPAESGAQLLQRILTERRVRWEAKQLAKFEAQGKAPPKDWQKKYSEPVRPDTNDLPELPEGWVWASLGQLLLELTSGSRDWAPFYDRGRCVFVMAQNVRPWRPDFSFKQFVDPPVDHRDRTRSEIQRDDLLVTIVGANTGQVCRVSDPIHDHFVCQSVALLRLVIPSMAEYVNAVLNSEGHGQRQFREMNYGAGRPHLSFDQLESVLVPLPPLNEQQQLVEAISNMLLAHNQVEEALSLLQQQSSAQRQNILRAAFSGQLVPQDPNDEPAPDLLARIRAERAAQAPARKPRGRRAQEAA